MTTLADKSLLSGGDNKPPMLEKHLYDSWKSRMELYMMNRPHGRMILASVEKGPLVWPSITEDGVTRLKEYVELTPAEAIQADCDIKAINIILQGLPTEIYALVSQHRVAKDLWEKIKLLMQGTSLTKQERECKLGKRCEKNYSSVRRYVADPDNAYPKRSITKLILKGAVIFDVVSYQFRCALNYSKLLLKLLNQEYVARIRGKLIQKLLLNQKCMGYLVRAYYSISPTKYYKDDSCWSADLKSNTTEDVISI
ncbi:hypothetical protein Tco_0727305 [Tanacetum coccineum]|uniref:Integrase, catalytic region, zinc finger, CCHC-type, peptidase aspartic, catalytic n=1 Tax=Tanacetum coccineum TaxID=301880 RepID=A0ABQ4YI26_9ASTR